jgi:hypothetical protein
MAAVLLQRRLRAARVLAKPGARAAGGGGLRAKNRRLSLVAATLGFAVASLFNPHADAQARPRGAIYFQVIDTSVNPLAGAEVVLPHLGLALRLADEGSLLLVDVPDGIYLVQARHVGYKTEWRIVRVVGDTARAHFMLMPSATALDTVSVVADAAPLETRLREFLRRSATSPSGYFLTREDVERRRPSDLGALLQTVSGVVVQRAMLGPALVRSRRARENPCGSGMLVFIDGMLVNAPSLLAGSRQRLARDDSLALRRPRPNATTAGGTLGGGGARGSRRGVAGLGGQVLGAEPMPAVDASPHHATPLFDVSQVPLSTIAGVEVYPTLAGVPAEFRVAGAECGVVLIWTAGR